MHASRVVLPREERLLAPLPLLIDTVLRCVYVCPVGPSGRAAAAAASPTEGEEATLGVEEALEMMNVMYAALPTREAALTDNEKEDQQQRDREQEAEERAEDAGGLEEASPLPAPPRPSELPSLLDQLDELERHLAAQHNLREYGLLQPMAAYREGRGSSGLTPERAQQLLRAMARHTARRAPGAGASQWLTTREDMVCKFLVPLPSCLYPCLSPCVTA